MQKNWLNGWVSGKPQMLNPLNLVPQLMGMLTATWFWVKGNVLTTFRNLQKHLKEFIMNLLSYSRFFVTPSDSVAIIAANAVQSIPYFASGLKGVAR
jgi:hypothetical protein